MKRDTRIKPGQHLSPATEFKPGKHWRPKKPYWDRESLRKEYEEKHQSASEIAKRFGVTENAIFYWLDKHHIPRRAMSDVRRIKHWVAKGKANPMYGKRGILNHNWCGGLTPSRQRIYAKSEMRQAMRDVHKRDRICRLCGSGKNLEIHHIDPFSQSPLLVMDIGNMILLCVPCHKKLRGKERRWRRRLYKLIEGG